MNNPRDPRHRLLAETLQGDWAEGPVAAMAQRAARHARRRLVRRRAAVGGALLAAAVALAWFGWGPQPKPPEVAVLVHAPTYEIISDDEMQTLLRDRPLLILPQENRAPKIVLLDR